MRLAFPNCLKPISEQKYLNRRFHDGNVSVLYRVQTKELECLVQSVDSQLEETSRERDDAQDLVAWQRQLIERQLEQVKTAAVLRVVGHILALLDYSCPVIVLCKYRWSCYFCHIVLFRCLNIIV